MIRMSQSFRAFVVDKSDDAFTRSIKELTIQDLPPGEVLIRVHYSDVNYKDGLASIPNGRIVREYPFVPGIDLSGTVVESADPTYAVGEEVIVTGFELGVSHFGGYSEYARVPSKWIVKLPKNLSLKESMVIGTAGFTAALSILKLLENGLTPDKGPVLVTGATGGVGSIAVPILKKLGFHVVASTGKRESHEYLRSLGADEILTREELTDTSGKPLLKERWAGAVDPVGGDTLRVILSTTRYGGSVAVSGLTGGTNVATTVMPFILRGINLLGIDSVYCPMDVRLRIWEKLANEWKPEHLLDQVGDSITFHELQDTLDAILQGKIQGRKVLQLG
jgi:acrylyl-CoA reductase (NADPH)